MEDFSLSVGKLTAVVYFGCSGISSLEHSTSSVMIDMIGAGAAATAAPPAEPLTVCRWFFSHTSWEEWSTGQTPDPSELAGG